MYKNKSLTHNRSSLDRRKVLALGAAAAAAASGLATAPAIAAKRGFRWGSSSLGSSAYVMVEAFAQTANKYTDAKNSSLATAGTTENMALLGRGDLEFAHSTSADWIAATQGQKPYKGPIKAHQLFADAAWHLPPMVHAESKIMSIADLAGHRYSPSKAGSGAALIHHTIMRAAGLFDKIKWSYGSWNEAYNAFKAKQIDGVCGVITNGAPSARILQAEAAVKVRALDIPEDIMLKTQKINPGILDEMIGPDVWPTLTKPVRMPLITGIIAVRPDLSPEVGYNVTKAILDHSAEVRKIAKPLRAISPEFAVNKLMSAFPVNAGAAQYFKEKGVWRKELKIGS